MITRCTQIRAILLAGGALVCAGGLSAPAMAQSAAPDEAARPSEPASGNEIVVTAQRREERLSDVPMSVAAVGGPELQRSGVINTTELTQLVPGVVMQRATNNQQPTIRGVGTRNVSPGDEANVATYIDGVYMPDAIGTIFDLANIERIEILKGPQGTLFGRNATGGAINIVTRAPDLNEVRAAIEGTYGRFNYRKGAGFISVPIVQDRVGLSVTATAFADDGYVRNLRLNKTQGFFNAETIRAKLLIKPSDDITIGINGLYGRSANNQMLAAYSFEPSSQALRYTPGLPGAAVLNPTNIPASGLITTKPWTTVIGIDALTTVKQKIGDIHLNWDLGFANLSALASISETDSDILNSSDYSPLDLSIPDYKPFTRGKNQEVVLTSPGDQRFNWMVGVSLFQGLGQFDPVNGTTKNATTGAIGRSSNFAGQRSHAFAAFAEATYEVVDNLFITGGLRYTREKKDAFLTNLLTGVTSTNSATFKNTSPRAVIRYKFDNGSNIYASYTKGFKSGIFNPLTATGIGNPVRPEIVEAWEAGAKLNLGPAVNLELAGYHYSYTDLQVSTIVLVGNVQATTVFNAANARINGMEATLSVRPVEGLKLSAGLSLIDSKFVSFPKATSQDPVFFTDPATGAQIPIGYATITKDATGNKLLRAPSVSVNLGADYSTELAGGWLDLNANALISSKYFADVFNNFAQPAYTVINGSIGWRQDRDRGISVSVFGKNLTNEVYQMGFTLSSFTIATQAAKPRWFGVTLGYRY